MSDPEKLVPLQIPVPKRVRQRLKNAATNTELTMAVLGTIALDYLSTLLLEGGKLPPFIAAAMEKAREERDKDQGGD